MKKIIHYIKHIKKQPEETRRHILHLLTIIAAVVLLTFWVYSLGTNFANKDTQTKIQQGLKPFSVLKDNIPQLW